MKGKWMNITYDLATNLTNEEKWINVNHTDYDH